MDQLSSEIMLSIFKWLECREMVKTMRVCKRWMEIMNANKSLWRILDLPEGEGDWSPSILELFDKKSESSLEWVRMTVDPSNDEKQIESVKQLLQRSNRSLRFLRIIGPDRGGLQGSYDVFDISDVCSKITSLVDCIFMRPFLSAVHLIFTPRLHLGKASTELRTLSTPSAKRLFQSHLSLIDFVVSLQVEEHFSSGQWRMFLDKPARTLKDLAINFSISDHTGDDDGEESSDQLSTLNFPNLKVLSIISDEVEYPSWMKVPDSLTFMNRNISTPHGLPSISRLWNVSYENLGTLEGSCPTLQELRIEDWGYHWDEENPQEAYEKLSSLLCQRRLNVEAGMEIEGIKMIPLKTLTISFKKLNEHQLLALSELVAEVIDLHTVDRLIELEI